MMAIAWRLAAAFWASAQVGSSSSPARGRGPYPELTDAELRARLARQVGHISTVKTPSTRVNGPSAPPQNPQ